MKKNLVFFLLTVFLILSGCGTPGSNTVTNADSRISRQNLMESGSDISNQRDFYDF